MYTIIWNSNREPDKCETEEEVWDIIGQYHSGYIVIDDFTGEVADQFIPY